FFFQAEDGIRDATVTGVQTCALPIYDGMHGIAERVEDGGNMIGDVGVHGPDVFFGDGDEFGEAAVGVDAENIDLFADVAIAGARSEERRVGEVGGVGGRLSRCQ